MTNRELVLNAFQNKPVPRVPVGFWFHFLPKAQLHGGAYTDPSLLEASLAGHRHYGETFRPDFVKLMTDGYFFLPLDISKVEGPEDLDKVGFHAPDLEQFYRDMVTLVTRSREFFGDDMLIFLNIASPMSHLFDNDYLGEARFLEYLGAQPQAMANALDRIADALITCIQQVVKPGLADGIYLSVHNRGRGVAEDIYRQYVTPSEKKILSAANALSPHNLLHICGYFGKPNTLAVYQDYDAEVFNWDVHTEGMSLKEGKAFFGGKAVLGGFDNTAKGVLYTGTRPEIEAATQEILQETGTQGLILGADCTLPGDIDVERLNWVREQAAQLN